MMLQTFSLASSPNLAAVRVDKATSEFLLAPDWTMNIEICDVVNSDPWTSKEVIKQVKKRLQHKNPRVQLLSLTLLETIVKNCGEHIHVHIAERKILDEMSKLAKKRGDTQVRDKVLVLLDHWQEAFGGPGGKHSHYYSAYDELRVACSCYHMFAGWMDTFIIEFSDLRNTLLLRSGVQFPRRSSISVPIITPPATQPPAWQWQPSPGSGVPSNSSRGLDEAMASEVGSLSFSILESMRNVMELLADMLQAVSPNDRLAVKEEVIVDLVNGCRNNQKKLMQMLPNVVDEVLLTQGIELNDALQRVLEKHDAIASGSPLPTRMLRNESTFSSASRLKSSDSSRDDFVSTFNASSSLPSSQARKGQVIKEEEDEFARVARRHAKRTHVPGDAADSSNSSSIAAAVSASDPSVPSTSKALVLSDPPAPVSTTALKDQDMVDLLSIVLSSSFTSEEAQETPKSAPAPAPAAAQSHTTTTTADNIEQPTFNTYVAPWAQKPESQPLVNSPFYSQDQNQQQIQHGTQPQPQLSGCTGYSYAYSPPPWAATPGYLNGLVSAADNYGSYSYQTSMQSGNQQQKLNNNQGGESVLAVSSSRTWQQNSNTSQNPQPPSINQLGYLASTNSPPSTEVSGTLQHGSSLPSEGNRGGIPMNGMSSTSPSTTSPMGSQKPAFVPHYRLFEDLNVFGNSEGKMKSGPYSSASSNASHYMVGGRR